MTRGQLILMRHYASNLNDALITRHRRGVNSWLLGGLSPGDNLDHAHAKYSWTVGCANDSTLGDRVPLRTWRALHKRFYSA